MKPRSSLPCAMCSDRAKKGPWGWLLGAAAGGALSCAVMGCSGGAPLDACVSHCNGGTDGDAASDSTDGSRIDSSDSSPEVLKDGSEDAAVEPLPCGCNTDVNRDGYTNLTDQALVRSCLGDATGSCTAADFNCDGVVSYCDEERMKCVLDGRSDCCDIVCGACCTGDACDEGSSDHCESRCGEFMGDATTCQATTCTAWPQFPAAQEVPGCVCEPDADGDGHAGVRDYLTVLECIISPHDGCADINCDGRLDMCDAEVALCAFSYTTELCCASTCGACCASGTCQIRSSLRCIGSALFLENASECPAASVPGGDDAGAPDAADAGAD